MILILQVGEILLMDNVAIPKAFLQYYSNLYKAQNICLEKIDV